jgi:hypothetical protein
VAKRIATVSGTALVPGVSKNGRYYSPEAIKKAVARAQSRIGEGTLHLTDRREQPLSQKTHHAAGDDSTAIVGRLTSLTLAEDGSAKFTADIANTTKGRDIAALADTSDGKPAFLRGVSIRGAWASEPKQVTINNQAAETCDDIILHGLDYTGDPGVPGAVIDSCVPVSESTADGQTYIYESVQEATVVADVAEDIPEALVTAPPTLAALIAESGLTLNQMHTELGLAPLPGEAGSMPAALEAIQSVLGEAKVPMSKRDSGLSGTDGPWADPGYQADKKQRYQLDTKKNVKAAWAYINQKDNADKYTANQLKRIKGRIVKALKKFGVTVTAEHWLIDPAQELTESTTLAECMSYGDDCGKGSFYVSLTNGPVSVSVSSYVVDPADLDLIGRAAMDGAVKCLATIDPDMDGDMDVPGAPAEDSDDDMNDGVPDPAVPGTACPCDCGCAIPVDPDAANCPCTCDDCEICGSTSGAGETVGPQPTPNADAPTPPITISVESADPSQTPAPNPAAEPLTETEAPAMAEPTTPAAESTSAAPTPVAAPAAPTFTFEQVMAMLAAAGRPVEAAPAPAAPVVEAAPAPAAAVPAPVAQPAPVAESQETMLARLIAESQRTLIQELAESGALPGRRGLTAQSPAATAAGESAAPLAEGYNAYGMPAGAPNKPLHEYTTEELNRWAGPMVFEHAVGHYAGRRR